MRFSRRFRMSLIFRAPKAVWVAPIAAILVAGPQLLTFAPAQASEVDKYLDLPLVNRDASVSPGGVNPALPYDPTQLRRLLDEARAQHIAPPRYAALLEQYWLVDATNKAGIDLRSWDPRAGVQANRHNLIASYQYYEQLQLQHRELQWAGMGGQVGADFGGGLEDFELMGGVYDIPGISQASRTVVNTVEQTAGPQAKALLPRGLQAIADTGAAVTPEDLHYLIGLILVMQKNIFSDLMPMHDAYVTGGLPAVAEFQSAGLIDDNLMQAWRDVRSGDNNRIAAGNAALLRREQQWAVGRQWDEFRNYKGGIGEGIAYLSGAVASPSVAGVIPPRAYKPVQIPFTKADGTREQLTLPLPSWNWSVLDSRWDYITAELLPKYKDQIENNWPALQQVLQTPYEWQFESRRPILNIPGLLTSAVQQMQITPTNTSQAG